MRNRQFLLSAAAIAALGLAACNQHAEQTPAAPATGAPIASLPLAEGAPPPLVPAPDVAALPSAPPVKTVSVPARERYRYIDRAYDLGEAFADSPPDYTVDYEGVRPWIWRSNGGQYRVVEQTPDGPRIYYYDAGSDEPFLVRDPRYAYGYDSGGLAVIYGADGRLMDYDSEAADRAARYLARARGLYRAAVHEQRQAAYAAAWQSRRTEVLGEQRAWADEQQRDSGWRDWREAHQQPQSQDWNRERSLREAYTRQTAAVVAAAALSANQRPPGPANAAPGQPFSSTTGQGPNGNAGRDAQAAQLRAQQQAQADRDAQAARERSQATAQAQAQAQQQKAQADREAQQAARQHDRAAADAQAQQQKAQADREAQRAARQHDKAAADAQAQQQKAQADREAQRAARQQAKAASDAQAQAQQAQQQKAQAQQEADRAVRQQGRAAKQAQEAQQAQAQAKAAQPAAKPQPEAQAAKPAPGQGNGGRDRPHPNRDKKPDQN